MEASVVKEVENLLKGDLSAAGVVYGVSHATLEEQLRGVPLVLHATAVVKVLHGLLLDDVSGEEAQKWASFVRRGFASGVDEGPIRPLGIDYEQEHEDAIVEAVARLDEIGDLIDGHIEKGEIADLLDGLHSGS
jgi:hypothetical protein